MDSIIPNIAQRSELDEILPIRYIPKSGRFFHFNDSHEIFTSHLVVPVSHIISVTLDDKSSDFLHHKEMYKYELKHYLYKEVGEVIKRDYINEIKKAKISLSFRDRIKRFFYQLVNKEYKKVYKIENVNQLYSILMNKPKNTNPDLLICSKETAVLLSKVRNFVKTMLIDDSALTYYGILDIYNIFTSDLIKDNSIYIGKINQDPNRGMMMAIEDSDIIDLEIDGNKAKIDLSFIVLCVGEDINKSYEKFIYTF